MVSASLSAATLASSVRWNNSLAMVALTMLYYDYSLTLSTEIEHFWKRARFSLVSVLFVTNRYLGLLGSVPVVLEYFVHFKPELQMYHQYYAILGQVIVGVILILRTYALYERSRRVLVWLSILGLVLAAGTLIAGNVKTKAVTANTSSQYTFVGCDLSLSAEHAIGWIAMLCLDTTVFTLTVVKTFQMRREMRQRLLLVFFRDGTILVVANAANIVTFLIGDSYRGIATTLTNALSTTLISRICLNLRDPSLQGDARRIGRWTLTQKSIPGNTVVLEETSMLSFHRGPLSTTSGDIMLITRATDSYVVEGRAV
ncbi:hypothetical protein L227DRAFT_570179 [Lentinus tigrinus ALCF2SS1-6]|uniref:DUF6533 domain-containing protein n=1 Tax=Lentinus tigrinus ALCF2SS1-6 TaxID=1328759 RepID=A0A5C2SSE2_9APHY|nr:hypothetical protein L227DRAFT_570179 [Lentinus tigrinus ALCF2SS1-6]